MNRLWESAFADDEVMDMDELSAAILAVGKRQTREIHHLKKQIDRLQKEATAWIIRAGVAENMTQTQIHEAINDMKGI
jgi:hypothetical protein